METTGLVEEKTLIDKIRKYLPPEKLPLVEKAYQFALEAHTGQLRKSGEPYLIHPVQTAMIVADLQLDAACVAAALLHDVSEDCGVPLEEIEARFGAEIRKLVEGVTKLGRISTQSLDSELRKAAEDEARIESLRKMFVAMAEDIRVVLIKLSDRLHNMRTLKALSPEKQLKIAQETMDIYVPLAHRLGIWEIKWQLEDLAFRYLQPEEYHRIARLIASRREVREQYIGKVMDILKEEFQKAGIEADVVGRAKNIYSIYNKTHKYAAQGKEFNDIHDLLAVRVLVNEIQDCYSALGVVHSLWHPLPGQFNDYIANPKGNLYQSLHTTVMGLNGRPLEIQIRTHQMHHVAEYGVAAHWRYKESHKKTMGFEEKITWLRQLIDWQRGQSGAGFLESIKTDIFRDQVFVYTPRGDIKELPQGATPLDFAYRVHTDLGHKCIGAKINGRLVSLDYQLRNGDTVEIMTTKADRGPSLDWLNPDLGYVRTHQARERIRQWFRRQERAQNIQRGRELLERELKRLGIGFAELERVAGVFKFSDTDDFYAAIGCGDISPNQIALKLTTPEEKTLVLPTTANVRPQTNGAIEVQGVGDLLTSIASCCHPIPGDKIVGFVTRSRGVTIHRKDCPNILNEDEKERLITVDWGQAERSYMASIHVDAFDRVGLLRDITSVVSEEKINIAAISNTENADGSISILLTLWITHIGQLTRLFSRVEGVHGVMNVSRSIEGIKPSI